MNIQVILTFRVSGNDRWKQEDEIQCFCHANLSSLLQTDLYIPLFQALILQLCRPLSYIPSRECMLWVTRGQGPILLSLIFPEGVMPVSLYTQRIHMYFVMSLMKVPRAWCTTTSLQPMFPVDEEGSTVCPVLS